KSLPLNELTVDLKRPQPDPASLSMAGFSSAIATSQQSPDSMHVSRLSDLAGQLSMASLAKSWQILLKGIGEVQVAPNPVTAAEMILIRLSYAADLPDPAELIRKLKEGGSFEGSINNGASRARGLKKKLN
ncbi:MAG: hypothetical protein LRY54_03625, partial [Alphaproteobacteria bacterium]|nr:hypothetical protein [Alphaproteobacteria bacterium]